MQDFTRFLTGLRGDARLGKYIPPATSNPTPETLVLGLALALADAAEGKTRPHPAHELLEAMEAGR